VIEIEFVTCVFVAVIVKTFVTVKFATDIFENDAAPTTVILFETARDLRLDAPVTFRDPVFANPELIYGIVSVSYRKVVFCVFDVIAPETLNVPVAVRFVVETEFDTARFANGCVIWMFERAFPPPTK
jgi:hypothetical protein